MWGKSQICYYVGVIGKRKVKKVAVVLTGWRVNHWATTEEFDEGRELNKKAQPVYETATLLFDTDLLDTNFLDAKYGV